MHYSPALKSLYVGFKTFDKSKDEWAVEAALGTLGRVSENDKCRIRFYMHMAGSIEELLKAGDNHQITARSLLADTFKQNKKSYGYASLLFSFNTYQEELQSIISTMELRRDDQRVDPEAYTDFVKEQRFLQNLFKRQKFSTDDYLFDMLCNLSIDIDQKLKNPLPEAYLYAM